MGSANYIGIDRSEVGDWAIVSRDFKTASFCNARGVWDGVQHEPDHDFKPWFDTQSRRYWTWVVDTELARLMYSIPARLPRSPLR